MEPWTVYAGAMLKASYTGRGDLIDLSDGKTTLTASYYTLRPILDNLSSIIPSPCPECEGTGDVVVEERDLVVCGTCKGSRVDPSSPRCQQCGEVGPGCYQFHDVTGVAV